MTIKITAATFSACVVGKDGIPNDQLPVIALVGRSNVGKSSLINCITGRRELARTSSMPGKTLTINYYCINDAFYIVDLPGYGYAKASKVTRQRIQAMMNEFFAESKSLKGVVQVLDIRHKPSPLDAQMQLWIKDQKINNIVVLTKADKLSNQQALKMHVAIVSDLKIGFAMAFSAKSASGKEDFLDAVEKILSGLEIKGAENKSRKASSNPRSGSERTRRGRGPNAGKANEPGSGPRPPRKDAQADRPKAPARKPVQQPDRAKPGEKTSDGQPDKTKAPDRSAGKPDQSQEARPGQNRRRRPKNRKSRGNDDKKKQPET